MKIVIAGAGEVGFHLIENLSKENLEISVIDINTEVLEKLKDNFGVATDHSSIIDSKYISSSHVSDADLFVAITNSDETNMIACKIAAEAGAKKTICRIKQVDFHTAKQQFSLRSLGIDWVINPVLLVAEEIHRLVMTPNIVDSHEFLEGEITMTGYRMTEYSNIIGKEIGILDKTLRKQLFQIGIIQRKNITFIPQKSDIIKYDDVVYFIYRTRDFVALRRFLGYAQRQAGSKRIFINGGGHIGLQLAQKLEKAKQDVRVIETDLSRAFQITEKLEKALVLNFDGTDLNQLKTEDLETADYFISVTNSEQTNITSCLLACDQGVERTICLLQQPELVQIVNQSTPITLGISPRVLTARYLVQFIQGTNISSYFSLMNSQIEVLEVHLLPDSKCLEAPLNQIDLPENVVIGIIKRGNTYLLPKGNTQLMAGDIILLILHKLDRDKAMDFFK